MARNRSRIGLRRSFVTAPMSGFEYITVLSFRVRSLQTVVASVRTLLKPWEQFYRMFVRQASASGLATVLC